MCSNRNVLVLGGTGRVGTETIKALARISSQQLNITLGGRNATRGNAICSQLQSSTSVHQFSFAKADITDPQSLPSLLRNFDLVIHTAGPFQRKEAPDAVLRAAMHANVKYMDVCDDLDHALHCKELHGAACKRGYTALISTGIYPGLSNLMAAEACSSMSDINALKLYYHTAGTGGIGATILASTFLLLSEQALCFVNGNPVLRPPAGDTEQFDFRGNIGRKMTYLLNLPEVSSLHAIAPNATIWAKFSTAPPVWNWLLQATAKWAPNGLLKNRVAMLKFSQFSLPIVRLVDMLSGARTAMAVLVEGSDQRVEFCFEHESLAACVGEATAAFAYEMLVSQAMAPGVHFPEQLDSLTRRSIINNASLTANFCEMKTIHTDLY
ncbi:Saccharopine dehydrogenase NADP binding protein [Gracilaria domingensis]|nr:Saccharopine dehydrogenase NADP binding protein [Gracilaria domingensis]